MSTAALLALEDGTVLYGVSIGSEGDTVGEVVFNTAMTGYQEILTDPSYAKQIVTLTYPQIGNVGCNTDDYESSQPWAAGLIIRQMTRRSANWRSQEDLTTFLQRNNIVAIADIDTRQLTQILRDKGAQRGCITTDVSSAKAAIDKAKAFAGLEGMDLAVEVTTDKQYPWQQGTLGGEVDNEHYHVVVYDFGVKHMILRLLVDHGCKVTVVPAKTPVEKMLALKPDGIMLSNGPGDPAACDYAIAAVGQLLEKNIPIFGICLGFQLLALACGARTTKMKFGHHGANHPVISLSDNTVLVTSQNHGFAVDESTLPADLEITHRSLFDNTLQGFKHRQKAAFGFQGHPEASPGPHDVVNLFEQFMTMMSDNKNSKKKVSKVSAEQTCLSEVI